MITTLRRISCDNCRSQKNAVKSLTDECYSDEEMRELAGTLGWRVVRVQNGSDWDFCPECFQEKSLDSAE